MDKTLLTDYRSIALLVASAHVAGILLTAVITEREKPPILSLTMIEVDEGGPAGEAGGSGDAKAAALTPKPAEPQQLKKEVRPTKAKTEAPVEPKKQAVVKKTPEVKPEIKPTEKVPEPVKPVMKPEKTQVKPVGKPVTAVKTNPKPVADQAEYVKSIKATPIAGGGSEGGGAAAGNKNKAVMGQGDAKERAAGPGSGGSGGGGDTKANHRGGYLNNPKPKYPELSRELGEEGRVGLTVTVEPNGSPSSVSVSRSSGYPRLDKAAERAVRGYRFKPATRDGTPIRSTYTFSIDFRLDS